MIRKLLLFSFLCFILGCQNKVSNIEDPNDPIHVLKIEGDVQFKGEIYWAASDDTLNTKIWAENIGTDTARIETGPCAFNVIAYTKNHIPVWYNRTPDEYICPDKLLVYEVAPKQTKQLTDQMYISGKNWYWDLPTGNWDFVIEPQLKTENQFHLTPIKIK